MHDRKYQFHMGCGEPLCSQWWRISLMAGGNRKAERPHAQAALGTRARTRPGRKG